MKRFAILSILACLPMFLVAQDILVTGKVYDSNTGEPLAGATVVYGAGLGTITDLSGVYELKLTAGSYTLKASFVGFTSEEKKVTLTKGKVFLDFTLGSITLNEVDIVADMATTRETPVAFSTILPAKLNEELGARDVPLVLNSTPGVYATPQGGGDGDAEVTIRGFDSRNVGVLLDGIPVNDMENGAVYWSNWFGLNIVTRSIQIQRGLGASKLALPSVGGTINIVTKGIEQKREFKVKQEVTSEGRYQTTLGLNSGRLPKGWGLTLAGSYKEGDGWVDATWSEAWFYYLKIDKEIGNHIISASAMGAPQSHGQRRYAKPVATYDMNYASELGVDTFNQKTYLNDLGYRYNPYWGYIDREPDNPDNPQEMLNERVNMYYKPMFSIRHFWNASKKLYLSNVAYLSIGTGGGTRLRPSSIRDNDLDSTGQINWNKFVEANTGPFSINPFYSADEHIASNYLTRQTNNHFWYGWLSTFNYQWNEFLNLSGGIDLRSYRGEHYEEIWDLLGGDYVIELSNINRDPTQLLRVGDKVQYHNDGLVKWAGLFTQFEYRRGKLMSFINLTGARSWYQRIDFFQYVSEEQTSEWVPVPGFTVKAGSNYNISEKSNVFFNLVFLSKARGFRYTFVGFTNQVEENIENENVKAVEAGYSFHTPRFTVNFNGYLTSWDNRPSPTFRSIYEGEDIEGFIKGLDAFHKGLEMDLIYKVRHDLEFQGIASQGDWRYDIATDIDYYYLNNQLFAKTEYFDASGVHVSGSAQTQLGGNIRYEPVKGLYIKAQYIRFERYFARFDPESLGNDALRDAEGKPRDSWKTPGYNMLDIHAGYSFKWKGARFALRLSMMNALDAKYIVSANNNDANITPSLQDFDVRSASVFFGIGRYVNTSLTISI